jgi:hypothetical protein
MKELKEATIEIECNMFDNFKEMKRSIDVGTKSTAQIVPVLMSD